MCKYLGRLPTVNLRSFNIHLARTKDVLQLVLQRQIRPYRAPTKRKLRRVKLFSFLIRETTIIRQGSNTLLNQIIEL